MRVLRLLSLVALFAAACGNNFADAPAARALHADAAKVYWLAGATDPKVLSVDAKNPGDPKTLATGAGAAGSLLVEDGDSLYWVSGGKIQSAPKAGGAVKTIASDEHITLVAAGPDTVYWVTGEPSDGGQQLKKVAKSGGDPTLLASSERYVRALAADQTGVFWTSADETGGTGGQVRFMTPVSGEPESIVRGLGRLTALVLDGDSLYFASGASIQRAPSVGGAATTLAQVSGLEVQALARAGTTLFALTLTSAPDADHPDTKRLSSIVKLPVAGGTATPVVDSLNDASALAANATGVFWLQPDQLLSIASK